MELSLDWLPKKAHQQIAKALKPERSDRHYAGMILSSLKNPPDRPGSFLAGFLHLSLLQISL
jgi:hypothetical protein